MRQEISDDYYDPMHTDVLVPVVEAIGPEGVYPSNIQSVYHIAFIPRMRKIRCGRWSQSVDNTSYSSQTPCRPWAPESISPCKQRRHVIQNYLSRYPSDNKTIDMFPVGVLGVSFCSGASFFICYFLPLLASVNIRRVIRDCVPLSTSATWTKVCN